MSMGTQLFWSALPLLLLATPMWAQVDKIRVHPTGHWFLDQHNRVRIFHGVNSVKKGLPWYPEYLLDNDRRADDLRDWGMNIVRLGTMWAGTEPQEGQFNATYIAKLLEIVKKLQSRGIYTMLDMHQDCLTAIYNGVPDWLVKTLPAPTNPHPWPLDRIDFWEMNYLSQAVSERFQMIYNNTNEALDKWATFWEVITLNFRDLPGVIGYNFINEPWVGDYLSDSDLLLPGVAGKYNLLPTYDLLNDRIRRHDQEKIVFYEPVLYGQVFHDGDFGSGFDRVPGGAEYRNVSAFSYHMYCWALEFLPSNHTNADREDAKQYCKDTMLPSIMRSQAENVNATGGAAILTEYGLCQTFEEKINTNCTTVMELSDEYLQSWIDWDYTDGRWYTGTGPEDEPIMARVSYYIRPYARAIAGEPTSMTFDHVTLVFRLEFVSDPDIKAPTEIFVPPLRYAGGYQVALSESLAWETGENDVINVRYVGQPGEKAAIMESVHVEITAQ